MLLAQTVVTDDSEEDEEEEEEDVPEIPESIAALPKDQQMRRIIKESFKQMGLGFDCTNDRHVSLSSQICKISDTLFLMHYAPIVRYWCCYFRIQW